MKNIDFELGRLSGILEAFAIMNSKSNHNYSFEIVNLNTVNNSQIAFRKYFFEYYPEADIQFEKLPLVDFRVYEAIKKWLFSYQKSPFINEDWMGSWSDLCYLEDKYQAFTLTREDGLDYFLKNFIEQLISLIGVRNIYKVNVSTDSWYECEWDDFIFEGLDGSIFLHLGVSD